MPVGWSSAVVSECQNSDRFGRFEIDDVIGKSFYRDSAYRQIGGSVGHGCASLRQPHNPVEGGICGEKLCSKAGFTLLVPANGVWEFPDGLVFRTKWFAHRFRRSRPSRVRTSSRGVPEDSPASTLRARLSISTAHAASTSPLSADSSRLASSSAAISARLSGDSFMASSSSCFTSVVMPSILPQMVSNWCRTARFSGRSRLVDMAGD